MLRRAKPKPEAPSLFTGLLRGVPGGDRPAASREEWPSPEMLAGMERFRFDPSNPGGKVPLGVVRAHMDHAVMAGGRVAHAAMGGAMLGVLDDRNEVITAGSRSGKGRSHILPRLILDGESSYFSIDPKGDHARETALWRSEVLGDDVYVVDPYGTAGEGCAHLRATLNPFRGVDGNDADAVVEVSGLVADAIVVPSPKGDSHWDDTAKELIEGVSAHVKTAEGFGGRRTVPEVSRQINLHGNDPDGELARKMISSTAAQGFVAQAALSFFGKEDRERSSVLSTARRHLHFLSYPKIAAVLQDSPRMLNSDDYLSRKMSGFHCLPASKLGPAAGLLRLGVNLALAGFEKNENRHAHQHGHGGHRCTLLLDEYAAIGKLRSLEVAAGLISGLGANLCVVLQDLTQLRAIHRDRWETFLGNAGVLSFFGNTDTTTLSWIEKRLGTTEVRSASQRNPSLTQAVRDGELGASYSVNTHPLMSMAEIARIFDRDDPLARQLVFLPSVGPVIMQRALYDKHEAFEAFRAWKRSRGA